MQNLYCLLWAAKVIRKVNTRVNLTRTYFVKQNTYWEVIEKRPTLHSGLIYIRLQPFSNRLEDLFRLFVFM